MKDVLIFILGACFGAGGLAAYANHYPNPKWHCTSSVRVGDTLPEQFECVEYSKKTSGDYLKEQE